MTTNNQTTDWRKLELGALWEKTSSKGETYMTGYIKNTKGESVEIVLFRNKTADNPTAPLWRVYKSVKREVVSKQPQPAVTVTDGDVL